MLTRRSSRAVWVPNVNIFTPEGVEVLRRRDPSQNAHVLEPEDEAGGWFDVDPQPELMVPVIDESDPHSNQRDSSSVTYGVLYTGRDDDVRDKDRFWFQPHHDGVPNGERFIWGVIGPGRWNFQHALTKVNFGVKAFRIRKGG